MAGTPSSGRTLLRFLGLLLLIATLANQSRRPGPSFTDVTRGTGITFRHTFSPEKRYLVETMSGGVALFDYDNDGDLDLFLVDAPTVATAQDPRSGRSELWRNNGNGAYTDVTDESGLSFSGWGMGVCTGDYDNDGWEDLYVTCLGANRLYRNNGDGKFSDVTSRSGVGDLRWSTGAAFADYDNDGRLDLFVANYVDMKLNSLPEFGKGPICQYRGLGVHCGPRGLPGSGDSLYHNNGDGTFTQVSAEAGVSDPSGHFGLGVVWCDFNEDGFTDLYVANDSQPNYLYRNNRDGTFTEVGFSSGSAVSENGAGQGSMGVTIGDYDHRARWSLFVTNFVDEYNALYRHERDFQFTDASFRSRLAQSSFPYVAWGTKLFDFDNDGWLDLLVVNGHVYPQVQGAGLGTSYRQRKQLYRNNRDGTFREITESAGRALIEPSADRGAAFGDIDNDGDIDVVVNNLDGAPAVLRNDGGVNNSLSIRLIGSDCNRSAYGTRVRVVSGDLVQVDECRSGGSYISQNDTRLHFGLGRRSRADSIDIKWPCGRTETVRDVAAGRFLSVTEGKGLQAPAPK